MNDRLGGKAALAVVLVCALALLALCVGCKEAPIPMSLSVDTSEAVTTYRVGATLNTGGIVAKLRMNDGTDKPVDARELHYACDLNHTGYQEVTASYKGLSDRFMVLVEAENGSLDLATGPWDLMVAAEGDMLRSYRVTAMYTDRQGSPTLVSGISPEVHMTLDGKIVEDGYELKAEDDGKLFTVEYKGVHTRGRTLTVLPLLPATGMKVRTVDSRDREYRAGETFRYPSNLWVAISYEGSGETRTVNLVDEDGNVAEGVVFLIDGTEAVPGVYEFAEPQGGTTMPVTVRYEKVKAGTVRPVLERGLTPFEDSPYLECSYEVAVKAAATVQSIAIAKNPDRMSYAGTDTEAKLDLKGLEVVAYMSDGTTKHVKWTDEGDHNGITTSLENGAVMTKDQDVKVTYGGKETSYKVTYTKDRKLASIKVITKPDKMNYNKGESFTAEGLSIRATYDDGSWNIIRYEDETDRFSFSPVSTGDEVKQASTVTVIYGSETDTFGITYNTPRKVTGIEIVDKSQYEVTLTMGDTYRAPSSVLVTVKYNDGSDEVKELPVSDWTDTNEAKGYETTVSYTDPNYPDAIPCTDSYTVTVKEAATVLSIKVLSKPGRTNYGNGDTFTAEGLILQASYSDGKQRTVVYDGSNMTFTGKDGRELDDGTEITADETVTVNYEKQGATFGITYKALKKVTRIEIVDKYKYEGTLTSGTACTKPNDMSVRVYYDDGTSDKQSPTNIAIPAQLNKGENKITVSYQDPNYPDDIPCADTYTVTVVEAVTVQSISIARQPDRMSYTGTGDEAKLNLAGMEVTAYMSDGTTKHVEWKDEGDHNGIATDPVNGTDITKDQDVKVTYGGKETSYKVTYTKDRELSSIKVFTKPDKTNYDKDEAFTAEGLSVRATYDDGSWNIIRYEDETDKFSFSPISVGTGVIENKTITVTYTEGGKSPTATFPVTYQKPRKVTGIEIVNKDQYQVTLTVGDTYRAPASVLVTVTYDDGSDEVKQIPVTDRTDTNEAKDYKTTVSYTDPNYPAEIPCTDSYTVTVTEAATVYSIKVLSKPSKTNYGSGDTFSAEGLIIRATYTDGRQRTVVYDGSNMTFTGKDGRTLDNRTEITADETVTVTYEKQSDTFGIMYKAPRKVTGITIVNKSQYEKTVTVNDGTYQNPSVLPVAVYYDDGTSEVEDGTVGTVDISTAGDKTVDVTYQDPNDNNTEYKDTYTVTVKELAMVKAISVAAPPDKVSYSGTEKILDLTGLKVLVVMSDGKTKQVEWSIDNANGITTVPANGTDMSAYQDVTVKYTEGSVTKGTTFPVTYKAPKKVTRIEIIDKYKYAVTLTVGTAYTLPTDMAVRVFYDDGTTEEKSRSDINISGTVGTTVDGSYTMVVTYTGSEGTSHTDTYTVTVVKAATVQSISVTRKPDKMSYTGTNAEAELVLSGLEITAYMSDGTSKLVKYPAEGLVATLDGNTTTVSKDNRTVSVTYGGQTTSFTVSYTPERKLESIVLLTPPDKTNYKPHEMFTVEGLALLATYNDGSQNIIRYSSDDTGFSFTSGPYSFPVDTEVTEVKTVQVSYEGKSVGSFGITYNAPKKVSGIQILDKYRYEVTLPVGATYNKPTNMSVRVFYDDGTSDVKDTTDSNIEIKVTDSFDTSQEKQVPIPVTYSDPNYPGESCSDSYTVHVVIPTIGDVMITSSTLVQGTTSNHATGKNPVNLDDLVNRVIFSSDVKGATYTYKYETTDGKEQTTGTVTAEAHLAYARVDIPAIQDSRTIYLTMVEKEGYKDYTATVGGKPLEPITGEVSMTLDQGTDNTDWKLSLSSTAGTKIQYRRNKGAWIDYDGGSFEIFDYSVPDDVSVVVVQARALDDHGRQVTDTYEAKYERVSVRFEYGYMNGLEPDLPYTATNKVLGRYPTITAIAPEGCEISAMLDEKSFWYDSSVYSTSYPSKKNILKFLAGPDETETTVRAYVIDPTGERMNWSTVHYYSSDSVTWEYSDNINYYQNKIGALGGIIVDGDMDGEWYYETVVPERSRQPYTLVCENARPGQGRYTIQELVDLEHSCSEKNRCQLWTLTHPFGEDGPVNLVSQMKLTIYNSIINYSSWLAICKNLIGDVGESPTILFNNVADSLNFQSECIRDIMKLTSDGQVAIDLKYTSELPLVGKDADGNINMICLFNRIGSSRPV